MAFDVNQIFSIDPAVVANTSVVSVARVDVFFKAKPNANNNVSGINYPGAILQILPVVANSNPAIPDLTAAFLAPKIRVSWADIQTSNTALKPTRFPFSAPLPIETGKQYAITLSFDGSDPAFKMWTNRQGDVIVGSNVVSTAAAGSAVFRHHYKRPPVLPSVTINSDSSGMNFAWHSTSNSTSANLATWLPISNTTLTCYIYCARYTVNGTPVTGNSTTTTSNTVNTVGNSTPNTATNTSGSNTVYLPCGNVVDANAVMHLRIPSSTIEYVTFDRKTSEGGERNLAIGEPVYQNTVYYPGGTATPRTVSVVNAGFTVVANSSFDWHSVYSFSGTEYIVVESKDHDGAGQDRAFVAAISGLGTTNNILDLVDSCYFTNSVANFFKSPVGRVYGTGVFQRFGALEDIVMLAGSNANGSVRFVNDSITSANATVGGTGYSNSDVVTFTGFENVVNKVLGGYPAKANIVTNATGGIVATYMKNLGCGFVNTAAIVATVTNSTAGPTAGSGATITANTGAMLKGAFLGNDGTGGQLNLAKIVNLSAHFVIPYFAIVPIPGAVVDVWHQWGYFEASDSDTSTGRVYYAYLDRSETLVKVEEATALPVPHDKQPVMPSRSNEWIIAWEDGTGSNATVNATAEHDDDINGSNASIFAVNAHSNNDFASVGFSRANTMVLYGHYIYNNDYTRENTDQGNCWAKYVSTTVDLSGNGAFAEDVMNFLTAYRPANTDLQVFVRLHRSTDSEPLNQKDWTRLQVNAKTEGLLSSPTDTSDTFDFQFTLQPYPNSAFTFDGTAQTVLNNTEVVGVGTSWSTNLVSNIVAGDLVKVWQPLFPNNYMISVVTAVTNNTSLNLGEPVTNVGVVSAGMKVDKIAYPKQAYNDKLNDNVATYWTAAGAKVIGFDQFITKICMLSSNDSIFPIVDDCRTLALSS